MTDVSYPRSPANVPADYVAPTTAYTRHAWLAVAGLFGFFALYIGATVWFATKTLSLVRSAIETGSIAAWVGAGLALFFFVFLAKALIPGRRHASEERVEITDVDQPRLFEFVHRIADEAGAPRPHKVYVAADVNAAVFYDINLSTLLFPSRKNLLIGLGLVNVLTLAEFKAVLAHEFGHFAQRTMAVGRWVYMGQQVAGRIVARRDIVDRFLHGISYVDIRFAWVGWLLRLVAWAIRALTETFFRLVIAAERALSREMELQADRVSVSLSGSDALVHALYRLQAADAAWGQARSIAATQAGKGQRVPDLLAVQTVALRELRRIFGDDDFGDVPPLPADSAARAKHRIFTAQLAQPPVMWSTHPPSHEREAHAKRPYIAAPLDERPAWSLFDDAEGLRRRLTTQELDTWGLSDDAETMSVEASLIAAAAKFDQGFLESRYHGLYLGRSITRRASTIPALYSDTRPEPATITAVLTEPYAASIADVVRNFRDLGNELDQLKALEAGVADAPGRAIQHRGQTLKRKQLRAVIADIERERDDVRTRLADIDRTLRTVHGAAAADLGEDWAALHSAHVALLHFAEHVEHNLDDAMGHLSNVFGVVTADGRVTDSELTRLLASAGEVHGALHRVWESRTGLHVGPAVAATMEVESWSAAFEEDFALHAPTRENIEPWLGVVDSWFNTYSGLMGHLRGAALEVLLDVEAHIRRCRISGSPPGPAPEGPTIELGYPVFLEGAERELQLKLGWWDRFVTADGWVPGAARLVVASSIVGVATFAGVGGGLTSSTIVTHNGLQRPVRVQIGTESHTIAALSRAEFDLDGDALTIEARTTDGQLIERFEPTIDDDLADYAYSVAGAVPLAEYSIVYGRDTATDPVFLGAPRWVAANHDHVFEEPPTTIQTRHETETRTILAAFDARTLSEIWMSIGMLQASVDASEQARVALVHGRWDDLPAGAFWLQVAHSFAEDEAIEVLAERRAALRADQGRSIMLERLAQEFARPDETTSVCDEHERWWAANRDEPDAAYLALRCRPENAETARTTLEVAARHPRHAWLVASAGFAHYRLGNLREAADAIQQARKALPSMAEVWAVFEARLLRAMAPGEELAPLDELEESSMMVRVLARTERGDEEIDAAFGLLASGLLQDAVDAAGPQSRARILRLAAASTGATEALVAKARALELSEDPSVGDAVATLIVARRAGADDEGARAAIRARFGDDTETVLAFANPQRLATELEALEERRLMLDPEPRGHAAVLGLATLGTKAPAQWSDDARRFLFLGERPYVGPRDAVGGDAHE